MSLGEGLIVAAGWIFLAGTLLVLASVLPALQRVRARAMLLGFALAVGSFAVVLAGWWVQTARAG